MSPDGLYAKLAMLVIVPPIAQILPLMEAFQGVIWHLIVSDPRMMQIENKWESVVSDKF